MSASDLILGVTSKSMAHTKARVNACDRGARYLSLPEYDLELLRHPALRIDFVACAARARRVADILTRASSIRVVSPGGTDIMLDARGRTANFCPGYVDHDHKLGSPPDIESNVSPVEDGSHGVVVVDGSIAYPGFGRLHDPVRLTVEGGRIVRWDGEPARVAQLEALFAPYPPNAKVLAEFGIGFNPEAKLCGNMLMDEGCYGAFHFGFGSNATVGGKNAVPFHVDFVFYASEFYADGELVRV
jgi:leucyl aminopeptidase (aminopeptidase T)